MSLEMIVGGSPKINFNKKKTNFGPLSLLNKGIDNSMEVRTTTYFNLRITNDDDRCYFIRLHTGTHVHCYQKDKLPIEI